MRHFLFLMLGVLLASATIQAQNFYLETSVPKSAGMNVGAKFTVFNNVNDAFALGVMGRIHRFSVANNGDDPDAAAVVNAFDMTVGGGFKFNFVSQRTFQAYVNPMVELASYRGDAGAGVGAYLGMSKEIAWPLVFNFEVGARQRLVLWGDPIATNNRMAIFVAAGFGLNLLESYQGPGPVLLNKSRPKNRKIRRYY